MTFRIDDFLSTIGGRGGLAVSNLYSIELPPIPGSNLTLDERNLMCKAMNLPGRQIATAERYIGPKAEKVPYTFMQDDVSVSFNVTNDYAIRTYFDLWMNRIINQTTYEISYKENYQYDVILHAQQKKQDPTLPALNTLKNPYSVRLERAYPTTMNANEFNNETTNGLVELNVQLSYYNWSPL
jgi:hypothetical protein